MTTDTHTTDTPTPPEERVVGVQFELHGEIYFFSSIDEPLFIRDRVVAKRDRVDEVGQVVIAPAARREGQRVVSVALRKATESDLFSAEKKMERANEALTACRRLANEMRLPMRIIKAHFCENDSKLQFIFTAEDRVDFRALLRELATTLRLRIEMKQVGARDEAKLIGALGPCGHESCCSSHIREFKSIGIAMAKDQQLSPNPTKLSGMCGKLKCCLSFEHELYRSERKNLPKVGKRVHVRNTTGEVIGIDILRQLCDVRLDETHECLRVSVDELRRIDGPA